MNKKSTIFSNRLRSALLITGLLLTFNFEARAQASATQTAPAAAPQRYEVRSRQQQIDNTIAEDKEVSEMLAPYTAGIKDKMNTVIGFAPEIIKKDGRAGGRLGMLISDIVRHTVKSATERKIDLAIMNVHGIRVDEIPAGEITIGLIYRLMPFENEVAIIEMSGSDLVAFLEAVSTDERDTAVLSGAQITFRNGKLEKVKIGDQPIDMQATYTIGINDYLYSRGGEYSVLQRGKNYQLIGKTLRESIIDYIRSENTAGRKLIGRAPDWLIIQ
jgi:2',3'-cyclic-nucleotide 2'-phosphodiesterase (5'-nucleotidase family)